MSFSQERIQLQNTLKLHRTIDSKFLLIFHTIGQGWKNDTSKKRQELLTIELKTLDEFISFQTLLTKVEKWNEQQILWRNHHQLYSTSNEE